MTANSELFTNTYEVAIDASVSICQTLAAAVLMHISGKDMTNKSRTYSSDTQLVHLSIVFGEVTAIVFLKTSHEHCKAA